MKNTNKKKLIALFFAAVIIGFPLYAGGGSERSGSAASGSGALSALLRGVRPEVQKWGESSDQYDVRVYSLNPEVGLDTLTQAVKEAGFYQGWSGDYTRDWDLQKGVLRWCVSPDTERWDNEIQFSAAGDTTVHTYGFKPVPNSDGVHKTIIITGYNSRDGITTYSMQIQSESKKPTSWPPVAVAIKETDGQTITYRLGLWQYRWENLEPWTGTGKFFIVIECQPPKDKLKDGSKYVYSLDGKNPTLIDIKDEVTTLEWAKFIWIEDYTAG